MKTQLMPPENPLYQIQNIKKGPDFSCKAVFNQHHPILLGHFPGNPVVPGAWLIRIIHDLAENVTGIKLVMSDAGQVKFLQAVLPDRTPGVQLKGNILSLNEKTWKVNATIFIEETIFVKFKGTFRSE